jgi:ribonuclease HI
MFGNDDAAGKECNVGKKKYYAVRKGKKPSIYTQWFGPDGAQVQVVGFPGAEYKGFGSRSEAERFMLSQYEEKREDPEIDDDATQVFTDGGAVGNPGPGGYGVVILKPDGQRQEMCGGYQRTTNNRMEMMGCITALESLGEDKPIVLHSDSRYLVDAVNKGWARAWQRRGWKKANGEPALNIDLWKRLLPLLEKKNVRLKWVKGHAGNVWNERCDQLVHEAIAKGDLRVDEGYCN